ncbi:MAG TPA: hypothetical protein VMS17_13860 [Gemmataceae bacterium]|nr:hypothetical protein [Gemmataceae bacterium]
MANFGRRDGETAVCWAGRLRFADAFARTAGEQDALHLQRGLAAAAVEAEEERREAAAPAAAESGSLQACQAAVAALAPADQRALLSWLEARLHR